MFSTQSQNKVKVCQTDFFPVDSISSLLLSWRKTHQYSSYVLMICEPFLYLVKHGEQWKIQLVKVPNSQLQTWGARFQTIDHVYAQSAGKL